MTTQPTPNATPGGIPNPNFKSAAAERAVMARYDALLAAWPVPHAAITVPTHCGDTFVIASGPVDAPPLVLLHGAGSHSAVWAGDVVAYSRAHRVYAVDLPGEAGRSTPARPPWQGPAFADWLADVLDGLHVPAATLLGVSQGGWAALKLAVAQPERVTRLVLLAPAGVTRDRRSFMPRVLLLMLLGTRGLRSLTRQLFAEQNVLPGVEDEVIAVTRAFKPRIGVVPLFSDDDLARLTMPVLLLGGTRDIVRDNDGIADRLREHLPHLSVMIISGAGHALLDTTGLVLTFLNATEGATGKAPATAARHHSNVAT